MSMIVSEFTVFLEINDSPGSIEEPVIIGFTVSRKVYFIHSLTHILTTCVTCVTSITCIACINCITCITLISFITFTIKDFYFMHYLHYLYQFPIFRAAKKSALFPKKGFQDDAKVSAHEAFFCV